MVTFKKVKTNTILKHKQKLYSITVGSSIFINVRNIDKNCYLLVLFNNPINYKNDISIYVKYPNKKPIIYNIFSNIGSIFKNTTNIDIQVGIIFKKQFSQLTLTRFELSDMQYFTDNKLYKLSKIYKTSIPSYTSIRYPEIIQESTIITPNNYKLKINNRDFHGMEPKNIAAIIPVYGREPLLKYTIRRLKKKNNIKYVICVGLTETEKKITEDEGGIFLEHPNKPLGKKWNYGFKYASQFNPDAILFVGSSDWVSDDWIDNAYPYLNDYGYIGKNNFDMVDIYKNKMTSCKWYGYIDKTRKNETIGIGRLLSKKFLEKIDYQPFMNDKDSSMDRTMYNKCLENNMSVKILTTNSIFLSVSCDLWHNKHIYKDHYNGILLKQSPGWNLFKNGDFHTEIEKITLLETFPELVEFYYEYLLYPQI